MKEKMKEKQNENFVMVNRDLMASKRLSSTQKLFVSYILGWQKNNLICKETNNNLASRFGMEYSGIRSLLRELNKRDFFKSKKIDYNETNSTSGHEITVNESKLLKFLKPEVTNEFDSTKIEHIEQVNSYLSEDLISDENELESFSKYDLNDMVDLYEVLFQLHFNQDDMFKFMEHFKSETIIFDAFVDYFINLITENKNENHKGIKISKEQEDQFNKMLAR